MQKLLAVCVLLSLSACIMGNKDTGSIGKFNNSNTINAKADDLEADKKKTKE